MERRFIEDGAIVVDVVHDDRHLGCGRRVAVLNCPRGRHLRGLGETVP